MMMGLVHSFCWAEPSAFRLLGLQINGIREFSTFNPDFTLPEVGFQ
ncbi:MAG: hypothetical protein HY785_16125 [Oscillatoriophycideae cyanobacterium NC_groundwater_1537_Pr4_S-0.65um_50_18]|nr:hypothetical protein [Oscillatoriophycideae cyanobacterium NC_groundwater_1537_Pr4_S-0.65um_50_18]